MTAAAATYVATPATPAAFAAALDAATAKLQALPPALSQRDARAYESRRLERLIEAHDVVTDLLADATLCAAAAAMEKGAYDSGGEAAAIERAEGAFFDAYYATGATESVGYLLANLGTDIKGAYRRATESERLARRQKLVAAMIKCG